MTNEQVRLIANDGGFAMAHFLRCGYAYGWDADVTERYRKLYVARWFAANN